MIGKGPYPLVGSSRNTTSGLVTKAIAKESFLFWPPERLPVGTSSFSRSATSATALTTAFFGNETGQSICTGRCMEKQLP